MKQKQNLEFNIIVVPDKKTGQFTAFFAQFPQAIAIGDTESEAQLNLMETVKVMMQDKRNAIVNNLPAMSGYKERNFNAEFSFIK